MLKTNRSSHLVPLITRLQTWGYDIDAVKPVAKVVDKLDSATLSLIERLVHDLTQLNECSHDLRNQVNTLTGDLDHEKQLLDHLRAENQRLLSENSELRVQVRKILRPCSRSTCTRCSTYAWSFSAVFVCFEPWVLLSLPQIGQSC